MSDLAERVSVRRFLGGPAPYEALIPAGAAAAAFLSITPLLHVYQVAGATALFVIACVGSTLVSSITARLSRQPAAVAYAVSGAALLLLLVIAAGVHPVAIWRAFVNGPNRVLTETLPLTGLRVTLVAPLVLTWVCGAATTELLLRGSARRGGLAGLGLVVPVAVYALTYAVGASAPRRDVVAGPVLLVVVALIAVARHHIAQASTRSVAAPGTGEEDARPPVYRAPIAGGATVIALTVILAAVVPSLPSMSKKPASLSRAAPVTSAVVIDPLSAMESLRDSDPRQPARNVMRVITDGPSTGYEAMAVLDHYDGAVWGFNATFQPTGLRVPDASESTVLLDSVNVGQRVTISGLLPLPFLPALDRPTEVSGLTVAADATTGMLLPGTGRPSSISYNVVSRAPRLTLPEVPIADGFAAAPADLVLPAGSSDALGTAVRIMGALAG